MATTMFLKHKVRDYDNWKRVYDEFGATRKTMGVIGASVGRDGDDPNVIIVTHRFSDPKAAHTFVNDDRLKEAMGKAGVASQPEFWFADEIEQTPY